MIGSIFYNLIDGIEKGIVVCQPAFGMAQMHIDLVGRNQAGHGFAPFCNKNMFFAKGHPAQKLRKMFFGFGDIYCFFRHGYSPYPMRYGHDDLNRVKCQDRSGRGRGDRSDLYESRLESRSHEVALRPLTVIVGAAFQPRSNWFEQPSHIPPAIPERITMKILDQAGSHRIV